MFNLLLSGKMGPRGLHDEQIISEWLGGEKSENRDGIVARAAGSRGMGRRRELPNNEEWRGERRLVRGGVWSAVGEDAFGGRTLGINWPGR